MKDNIYKSSAVAEMAVQCCMCHVVLVNNINIHPTSLHFQVIMQY